MGRISANFRILFTLFVVLGFSQSQAFEKSKLYNQAENSIYEYFQSSGRKVEKVAIESYSRLASPRLDYLVEGEAFAESPLGQNIIGYHCGVFVKKMQGKWVTHQTDCEAISNAAY
jgi:hypothetical protein